MITQRLKIYLLLVLLLTLAAVFTSGCSGSAALLSDSGWPGINLFNDSVYVAYGSQVYAIDPRNGEAQWAFPEEPVNGQTFFTPPAASDDVIVVTDYRDSLFALNPADGTQQWVFKSEDSHFIGGAAIGEDFIYAATEDGAIHALDRETGLVEWSYETNGSIWSTPLLADGVLYITALDRRLYVLDAETGTLSWQFSDGEEASDSPPIGPMVGTPTLYEGVLYFGSFNNRVYAVSTETRGVLWTYDTTNWVWSSPVIDESNKQLIGADLDGHIFALTLEDGTPIWTYDASGPVVGAPLLDELANGTSVVYLTCDGDPNLLVLKTSDGEAAIRPVTVQAEFTTKFLFFNTGENTRPVPIFASPVSTADLLIVGVHQLGANQSGDILYALDRESLQEEWRFNQKTYERQETEEQEQEEPTSFFSSPINILLFISITLLMFTLFGRGRRQQ
ncbi:MAG: PQQ-binding-like beta-propeller repeat protein [Anaerolineae bacterium]|nr:PQQ-binding-like beta-propeller repeat protein [Anaerolineae bacterium]